VPSPARLSVLHALRSRDFRLLWSGQTVSLIGNGAFFVAIGWRVTSLTGRASSLALVLLAMSLAMLATLLVGGALADRYERRRLMISSDLVRAAVVALLAAIDATGRLNVAVLLALAVGVGLGDGFFHPAFGGIVPQTVEADALASANALIEISRNGAFIVGPALAGILYGLAGSSTVFAIDAATFVFSALLLLRARPRAIEAETHESTWRGIVDGARYVASVPWLWIAIALASFVLMVAMAPFQSLLPHYVETHFHRGVGAYGALFTAQAAGMVLASLAYGQVAPRRHRTLQIYGSFAANDVVTIALVLSPWYGAAIAAMVLRGVFIGIGIVAWDTLVMEVVPESKLSRVISLDYFGSLGLTPVGYALTAAISGAVPAQAILLTGFSLAFLLWTTPLFFRRVRTAA
jgi:MFS family permease